MKCHACKFFDAFPRINIRPDAPGGLCHRFPPTIQRYPVGPGQQVALGGHVEVTRNGWCGEFKAKLEAVA